MLLTGTALVLAPVCLGTARQIMKAQAFLIVTGLLTGASRWSSRSAPVCRGRRTTGCAVSVP
jgi:hypothetical protein